LGGGGGITIRFFISSDAGGSSSQTKKDLLKWVNQQIAPYSSDGVSSVKNFAKDWQDGKALSALTDSLQPGVINMKELGDPIADLQKAIDVASDEYDIIPRCRRCCPTSRSPQYDDIYLLFQRLC